MYLWGTLETMARSAPNPYPKGGQGGLSTAQPTTSFRNSYSRPFGTPLYGKTQYP